MSEVQIQRIADVMSDSEYRTLREIADVTGFGETSISAQLRNLRKPSGGLHNVSRRHRKGGGVGVWEYAVGVQSLDALAIEINEDVRAIKRKSGEALQHARSAGEKLIAAKANLDEHGAWEAWIAEHFEDSYRTAARYMVIAKGWPELAKVPRVALLSIRDAEKLLTSSNKKEPVSNNGTEYEITTERSRQLAGGQKRRLIEALSRIDGYCAGLASLKLDMAFAVMADDERNEWAEAIRAFARQLSALARTIKTEG